MDTELLFLQKIPPKTRKLCFPVKVIQGKRWFLPEDMGLFRPRQMGVVPVQGIWIHQLYAGKETELFEGAMPIGPELFNLIGTRVTAQNVVRVSEWAFDIENETDEEIDWKGMLQGEAEEGG